MAADLVVERGPPRADVVGGEPDFGERSWGRVEGDAFELGLAIPGERAIPPAELFVVLPGFSVVDLACVGVGEVDARVGERGDQLGKAVGGEFVVVVDIDEHIASTGLAGKPFQFTDILSLAGIWDDAGLREIDADLARVAVGDDDPLEVGVCLASDRAGQARIASKRNQQPTRKSRHRRLCSFGNRLTLSAAEIGN